MARRKSTAPDLPHLENVTLEDGRTLNPRDEFRVKGEGRFVFLYGWEPDGSITAFGPVNSKSAMIRSFRQEQVAEIHRNKMNHTAKKAEKEGSK